MMRCVAPNPGDWNRVCGARVVPLNKHGGRPRIYCSDACRQRAHYVKAAEEAQQAKHRKPKRR